MGMEYVVGGAIQVVRRGGYVLSEENGQRSRFVDYGSGFAFVTLEEAKKTTRQKRLEREERIARRQQRAEADAHVSPQGHATPPATAPSQPDNGPPASQ